MYDIYVRLDPLDPNEIEDKPLWAPGLEDKNYILYSAILELQLNHSGKLTFQMSPKHPLYDSLKKRKTRIIVRKNGVEYWRGRILDSKTDFYKRRIVVCEGALSYLIDSVYTPDHYWAEDYASTYIRIDDILEEAIRYHNWQSTVDKKIKWYRNTVDKNLLMPRKFYLTSEAYKTVLDHLNDELVDKYGGYLKITSESDGLYLDYLPSSGKPTNQKITFGKNLLDIEEYITAENICTRVYPLGATYREIDEFYKATDPNYKSTLTDYQLEIYGDLRVGSHWSKNAIYVDHEEGKSLFGIVSKSVIFDGVVTEESLKERAKAWLDDNVAMNMSIDIKAIDLSLLTDNVDAIDCGSSVEIISEPHGIDMWMVCGSLAINILSPAENHYTFGSASPCMSDQQARSLKQSAKAFDTASSTSTSVVRSTTSSAVAPKYLLMTEFDSYKGEVNKTFDAIVKVPNPTSLDEGKVLKIVEGKWAKADDDIGVAELPAVTTEHDGMILKVVNGKWTAVAAE